MFYNTYYTNDLETIVARIKNFGTATMKFGEGVIVSGSAGSDIYAAVVTGSTNMIGNSHAPTLNVYNSISSNYVAIIDNDQSSAGHGMKITSDGTGTGTYLLDLEAASTTLFRFRADGRLGIGIEAPTVKLDVAGNIKSSGDLYVDKIRRASDSGTTTKILLDDEVVKIYAGHASENICTINSTGLTVAGTTHLSSSAGTEVLRIAKADGDSREIVLENEGADAASIYLNSAEHLFIRQENASNDLCLRIGSTNALRVDGSASTVGIWTDSPGSGFAVNSSFSLKVAGPKTSAYTITGDDSCVIGDCNAASITLTLPSATDAMAGRVYTIKRLDSGNNGGGNMLTISRNGKNIDGVAGDVLLANLDALVLQCIGVGAGWIRIGQFLAPM